MYHKLWIKSILKQFIKHVCGAIPGITPKPFYPLIVNRFSGNKTSAIQTTVVQHKSCNFHVLASMVSSDGFIITMSFNKYPRILVFRLYIPNS